MGWFNHQLVVRSRTSAGFTKNFRYIPKIEVLNLIRLLWGWVFPYVSRIHTAYIGEDSSILGTWIIGKLLDPSCLTLQGALQKGIYPINTIEYPLCKVYMGLIIKGTIPRVPPFSLWLKCLVQHLVQTGGILLSKANLWPWYHVSSFSAMTTAWWNTVSVWVQFGWFTKTRRTWWM